MLIRLIVPGEYARVEDLNASLEAVLKRHGMQPAICDDVRLIVEELASNAIQYGHDSDHPSADQELSVDIHIQSGLLHLEFRDTGAPFDPLSAPPPDLDVDIQARDIGGLGLYLIRQLAHRIHYQRTDTGNLLQVSLRIPQPESQP